MVKVNIFSNVIYTHTKKLLRSKQFSIYSQSMLLSGTLFIWYLNLSQIKSKFYRDLYTLIKTKILFENTYTYYKCKYKVKEERYLGICSGSTVDIIDRNIKDKISKLHGKIQKMRNFVRNDKISHMGMLKSAALVIQAIVIQIMTYSCQAW